MPAPYTWTPEQIELLRGSASQVDLARRFGCSHTPIVRWRRANGWTPPATATPADGTEIPSESGPSDLELAREEVRRLKAQVRRSSKQAVGDERVLRAIEAAVAEVEPVYLAPLTKLGRTGDLDTSPHHRQLAIWSDWHYGEVVDAETVNGLGGFNIAICEDRVSQLVRSMLAFKRVRPPLSGLNIALLGDMASGTIHRLEETNEVPAQEQYVRVGYLIADAVRQLAPHYPEIVIDCTWGNHPRDTPEPSTSHSNGDWVAYQLAKALTRDLENVSWNIPRSGMVVTQIAGRNILLWHGDGVRSSMPGVPWGGIMRRWTTLKSTFAEGGVLLDFLAVGHYHQPNAVDDIWMNGALPGTNTHGLKNYGGGRRPRQLLVHFDERRKRVTDVSYVSFEESD